MNNIVKQAIEWAVSIAEDNSHGYDQTHRDSPDYDCSSLICHAYQEAGLNVIDGWTPSTRTMREVFIDVGFKEVSSEVDFSDYNTLQEGDVLLVEGYHTEMYIGGGQLVGAHENENGGVTGGQTGDQTGNEISVRNYYNYPWKICLRYGNSGQIDKNDLNVGNRYLSIEEMTPNAQYILDYLHGKGWTKEAVCALLGNMQTESTINPQIWQSLDEGNTSLGYGLVQWTPATKLMTWCEANGYHFDDIDGQLERIIWEFENNEQYYATDKYDISPSDFINGNNVEELAKAFLYNYERPAEPSSTENDRVEQALYWYNKLEAGSSGGGGGGTHKKTLYDILETTKYHVELLREDEVNTLKRLFLNEKCKMKHTFNKNKKEVGRNFLNQRLKFDNLEYIIISVDSNSGYVTIGIDKNTSFKRVLNPRYLKEVTQQKR